MQEEIHLAALEVDSVAFLALKVSRINNSGEGEANEDRTLLEIFSKNLRSSLGSSKEVQEDVLEAQHQGNKEEEISCCL